MNDFYETLIAELRKPEYSELTHEQAAERLNDPLLSTTDDHTFYTMRYVISVLVSNGIDASQTLSKLDAAAERNAVIAEGLRALRTYGDGGGLDFADPATRALLQQLHGDGILNDQEYTTLQTIGERRCSIAESLGLGVVNEYHVACARRMMQE